LKVKGHILIATIILKNENLEKLQMILIRLKQRVSNKARNQVVLHKIIQRERKDFGIAKLEITIYAVTKPNLMEKDSQ
jgi:hypothetical protein